MPYELPEYLRQVLINGKPMSLFADGTLLPVISGGADDEGTEGDGSDQGAEGADDLGETGKKALDAERIARKTAEKAAKEADKRAKELEARLAKLEEGSKSEHEKALEAARKEAEEAARNDERTKTARRIVLAEVRVLAAGRLADPSDAIRLLDLDEFEVDDDGNVNEKAVAKALDQLLKDKPYLAAKPKAGSADGGVRKTTEAEASPGLGRLRAAYASSNQK